MTTFHKRFTQLAEAKLALVKKIEKSRKIPREEKIKMIVTISKTSMTAKELQDDSLSFSKIDALEKKFLEQ
jgi:hypothetical protein